MVTLPFLFSEKKVVLEWENGGALWCFALMMSISASGSPCSPESPGGSSACLIVMFWSHSEIPDFLHTPHIFFLWVVSDIHVPINHLYLVIPKLSAVKSSSLGFQSLWDMQGYSPSRWLTGLHLPHVPSHNPLSSLTLTGAANLAHGTLRDHLQPHFLTLSPYNPCCSLCIMMPPIPIVSSHPWAHTPVSTTVPTCQDIECTTIHNIFSQKESLKKRDMYVPAE